MTGTVSRSSSGIQHPVGDFGYTAAITSVGATLRRQQNHKRDMITSFPADEIRPHYRGATLAPWPNRIVDGRYRFAGATHQLPLTEPTRGHALHGLASWLNFQPVKHSTNCRSGVFADAELDEVKPDPTDVTGSDAFMYHYLQALPLQRMAAAHI